MPASQVLCIPGSPCERDDQHEDRHRRERAEPAGERAKRGDERQHVAVDRRMERQQVREVHEDEHGKREICPPAAEQREREPSGRDHEGRAKPVPEPCDECNRRRLVVLEPEPTGGGRLNAPRIARSLAEVKDHIRACGRKRDQRQAARDRQSPPRTPGRNEERREQQDAGILRARRETDDETGEFDPPRNHEPKRDRDSERQRHVWDRDPRIRDVGCLDGCHRGGHEAGRRPVRALPKPPRGSDPTQGEHDHGQTRRKVGGLVLPSLERRQKIHKEARMVEPLGVEAAAVHHRPGSRDDVALVRAQEQRRAHVLDPREPEHTGKRQDCDESDRRASPPALGPLRPRAARHEPGRRCSGRRRSRRPLQRARAPRPLPGS